MANLVMLERFIENMCQIAVIWEGVIINSQKPLKSMVFCNYQASPSISTYVRTNGFAVLEAALILVIFRICLLISLTSG